MLYDSLPLVGNQIRILLLLPGCWDDAIHAQLEVSHLSTDVQYAALSYTWGKATKTRNIRVNQEVAFSVTNNLWSALRRLRREDSSCMLWIDAICINQSDIHERNEQVQRIYEIYQAAVKVIVWLGEPARGDLQLDSSGHDALDSREAAFEALDSVIRNADSLWWERAWTVQEVLASATVEVRFGSKILQWSFEDNDNDFVRWVDNYQFDQYQKDPTLDGQRMRLMEQCQWIKDLSSRRKQDDRRFTALADITMRRSCSDPRDRVFSLLGVMNPVSSQMIETNYMRPEGEIFTLATFAVIVGDASFEMLRFVNPCQPRDPNLPSWAVDFSALDRNAIVPRSAFPIHQVLSTRRWAKDVSCSDDLQELRTAGHILDVIEDIYALPAPNSAIAEYPAPENLIALLAKTLSKSQADSIDREDFSEQKYAYHGGSDRLRDQVNSAISQLLLKERFAHTVRLKAFHIWEEIHSEAEYKAACCLESRNWPTDAIKSMCWYAKDTAGATALFTTKRGFIGIAPAHIQSHDVVAIVPGGKCPFILRRHGECFKFMALSYVHGMGDHLHAGEINDNLFQQRSSDFVFRLT